jgi:hypothetical protein
MSWTEVEISRAKIKYFSNKYRFIELAEYQSIQKFLETLYEREFFIFHDIYIIHSNRLNIDIPIFITNNKKSVLFWLGNEVGETHGIDVKLHQFDIVYMSYIKEETKKIKHFWLFRCAISNHTSFINNSKTRWTYAFIGNICGPKREVLIPYILGFSKFGSRIFLSMRALLKKIGLWNQVLKCFILLINNLQIFRKSTFLYLTTGWNKGMLHNEYNQFIHDSKIIVCLPGYESNETFRHFEALMMGKIVISWPLPESNPFYNYFKKRNMIINYEDEKKIKSSILNINLNSNCMEIHESDIADIFLDYHKRQLFIY